MARTDMQRGGVNQDISSTGKSIWVFRWRESKPDGRRVQKKKVIGTVQKYPSKEAAERAARLLRVKLLDGHPGQMRVTMQELVDHFRQHELVDRGDEGLAHSTRNRFESVLNKWILPRWKCTPIDQIRTVKVEEWLRSISGAKGTKAKIRNNMSKLFNHAIRWEFIDRNPITGPVRGSGVRQSAKRERIPDVLEVEEFRRLLAQLKLREQVLVWLDMTAGLRRGELAGLRWEDINFLELTISPRRSLVDQKVGKLKTESSAKPLPIDPFVAQDLMNWYGVCKYRNAQDYVFATDSGRAGSKKGKQPIWLSKVMQYHIQPAAKRAGINKRIGWHTFRHTYTTLLHANHEDVKVTQELLRHASAKLTMDVYAQAVTPAKRKAQHDVVSVLRGEANGVV